MELNLRGKRVAITGGSMGIGRAAALAFLREGCRVAVCARGGDKLAALAREAGGALYTQRVDVADTAQLADFAARVEERLGGIDVWINNAGVRNAAPFDQIDEAAFERTVNVNLRAVYFGSAYAARAMKRAGRGGVIINTSSFTSLTPTAGTALYGATKAAADNLTRALAGELAAHGIRVVSVIPGFIRTGMTGAEIALCERQLAANIASGRLGEPEDLAAAFVFLASDAARYITGVSLPVAGGKLCVQNCAWSWDREAAGRANA